MCSSMLTKGARTPEICPHAVVGWLCEPFLPEADGVMGYTTQGGGDIAKLVGPFSDVLKGVVRDPFILNWLDLLSFLLSGSHTPNVTCFVHGIPLLKRF